VNFADLLDFAGRGLMRRPVRTALTVLGIVVAVASMVVFLSLGEGFRRALGAEIGNIGPNVQITLPGSDSSSLFGSPIPEVPQATVPRLQGIAQEFGITKVIPYLATVRGSITGSGFAIIGYPFDQVTLTDVYPNIKLASGRWFQPSDEGQLVVVVGSQAAKTSNLQLGDELRLSRTQRYKVIGLLARGEGLTDSAVFAPLKSLSNTLAVEKYTGVALQLRDPADSRKVADAINARFGDELLAQTQGDVVKVLDRAISIGDAFRLGISLISIIVGGLAVANTVMMGVYERTREFGVIRAIGGQPNFVFQVVLLESLLMAIIGGAGGIVVGWLGTIAVNFAVRDLISVQIASVTFRLVLIAVGVATVLGLVSGLLPARNASRLAITQALGRN
jgi:putative ABC transport system permease protein